jgi:hypothetical protein
LTDTILQLASIKLFSNFTNNCGEAVAVSARVGTKGKNAFSEERSLKSVLNSSPLKMAKLIIHC